MRRGKLDSFNTAKPTAARDERGSYSRPATSAGDVSQVGDRELET
jgi:hypothetical protein